MSDIEDAVLLLIEELKSDPEYRDVWESTIAVSFVDEYYRFNVFDRDRPEIQMKANRAAKNFIDLLIGQVKNE